MARMVLREVDFKWLRGHARLLSKYLIWQGSEESQTYSTGGQPLELSDGQAGKDGRRE